MPVSYTFVDLCIYHSDPGTNYGPAYKDDNPNNPKGQCGKALKGAFEYINGDMRRDIMNTIDDIFHDPNVRDNADFLLYVTGYARFFGTSYDSWCNDEHWNIPGISPTPYLSKELRVAFNDRVSTLNNLYKDVVSKQYAGKARYIDVDSGFSGHRFCEPGANHKAQFNTDTNFNSVYLWNLNWPWEVANQRVPQGLDPNKISQEEAAKLFNGGGVTAWTAPGGSATDDGWRLRPFHPRTTGYTSIKNVILTQLKSDSLPKAPSTPSPRPPPSPQPGGSFVPGTCSFHLDEWQSCADDSNNLFAVITMYDNAKKQIGQTTVGAAASPPGDPINANKPLNFKSELPYPLVVTGEHQKDYVQFNYDGLRFTSRDTAGKATCNNGGWDPRDGPICVGLITIYAVSHDSLAK